MPLKCCLLKTLTQNLGQLRETDKAPRGKAWVKHTGNIYHAYIIKIYHSYVTKLVLRTILLYPVDDITASVVI